MISLLNWNSGFSFKPQAANLMVYPGFQVCEMPISSISSLDLKARVLGPREPSELELRIMKSHMTQKPVLRVKWMRVRCACAARALRVRCACAARVSLIVGGWVRQARLLQCAWVLAQYVSVAINGRLGVVSFLLQRKPEAG